MAEKIVVGMSGGVDSSVVAYLLKKQGYEVIGVSMNFFGPLVENEDARRVCDTLGIPFFMVDFKESFKKNVVAYFTDAYIVGKTPNPCVMCNRYVKWEALLQWAKEHGIEKIATGHYARIIKLPNGRYSVQMAKSGKKDQTYALYQLTQEQLSHSLMPAGDYCKEEIREFAKEAGLEIADKPDSQEICFIPDHDYARFIEENTSKKVPPKGDFVNERGEILGQHQGITHYTIGQRKGLNLALGYPVFVSRIVPETNQVVISDTGDVFASKLTCDTLNFMSVEDINAPRRVLAKIRYSHKGTYCEIKKIEKDKLLVVFEEPVRAITPGQAIVFYEDSCVLGGGTIL